MNRPGNILASLSIYLPELAGTNVIDLLNSNPLASSLRYFKSVVIKGVKQLVSNHHRVNRSDNNLV